MMENVLDIYSRLSLSRIPKESLKILRDNRTSTYQICIIEEKLIRLTTFNKYMCNWTLEVKIYIENIVEKWRKSNFSSFP